MSSHLQDTTPMDPWVSDILARLPKHLDLDALARDHGAFTRVRAIPTAAALVRGLLAYAVAVGSLRAVGIWGVLTDVANIAPSSWLERLRKAGPFLQALVATLLDVPRPAYLTQQARGRVLLIDATCLPVLGGTGNDVRLHLAFDLLHGQFAELVMTDGRGGEKLDHYTIQPRDVAVLDGGYGYRSQLAILQAQQADGVVRIYPPTFPLEHSDGRALDVRAWLDARGPNQRSRVAYYTHNGLRYCVRVLALRQGERERHARSKRARARAHKRGRSPSAIAQYYADWVIVVTTLLDAQSWPDWAIWRLYDARWQVELVFKRLKSGVGLQTLRVRTLESARAVVWAVLVLWVLHEGVVSTVRTALLRVAAPHPSTYPGQAPQHEAVVSTWGCCTLVLTTLIGAIRGQWTLARIEACLPLLRRFLVTHPRDDREHQSSEVVAWLSGQRRTRARPLADVSC